MKRILITGLVVLMFLISGCAISDYLTGDVSDDTPSLVEENNTEMNELDQLIDELNEELEDLNVTDDNSTDDNSTEEVEVVEEEVVEEEVEVVEEEITNEDSFIKISVKENDLVKLTPKATDADEDSISYTFSEPLNEIGEWQTSYGDAGNYLITVTATDGELSTSKKVLLAVERVNVPPTIKGVDSLIEVNEGETLTIEPEVSDPNGDLVTVTISEPVGNDGVWEIGYQENGKYDLTITATDGELETVLSIDLTVNRKNVAPEIGPLEDITVSEGDIVEIIPVVSDVNGDDVEVTISEPLGNDGVWETGYTDNGEYEIIVKATDGESTVTKVIKLTVINVNKAPEIIGINLN